MTEATTTSSPYPSRLLANYEALYETRSVMETMKKNQSLRGIENYVKRKEVRATTHKTWRQMKGMDLFMHEVNHAGNKPFVFGFWYVFSWPFIFVIPSVYFAITLFVSFPENNLIFPFPYQIFSMHTVLLAH
jgi:hypothetical protein